MSTTLITFIAALHSVSSSIFAVNTHFLKELYLTITTTKPYPTIIRPTYLKLRAGKTWHQKVIADKINNNLHSTIQVRYSEGPLFQSLCAEACV